MRRTEPCKKHTHNASIPYVVMIKTTGRVNILDDGDTSAGGTRVVTGFSKSRGACKLGDATDASGCVVSLDR